MDTSKIILFILDEKPHFDEHTQYLSESDFKSIEPVKDLDDFHSKISVLSKKQLVFLTVHVFYTQKNKGVKKFNPKVINAKYPDIDFMYISDGTAMKIQKQMIDANLSEAVQKFRNYHEIASELKDGRFKAYTVSELLLEQNTDKKHLKTQIFDYAIITALYKDEFTELKKIFNFPDDEVIRTGTKKYHIGYLKDDNSIKVVAGNATTTGMVDTSIIATHMLELFKPKYLLMSGVCGGHKDDTDLGDIIIASQVFTFQKGKLNDLQRKDDKGDLIKIDLFNKDREIVDYTKLFDNDGNQVSISIESFKREIQSEISLDTLLDDDLNSVIDDIQNEINSDIKSVGFFDNKKIKIHKAPIACSSMVINKDGFFDDIIKSIDRDTLAVEMESYSVARACRFANDGKTKPIIFKSVMDFTHKKTDTANGINWKKFAAYTSAQFMKHLLLKRILI